MERIIYHDTLQRGCIGEYFQEKWIKSDVSIQYTHVSWARASFQNYDFDLLPEKRYQNPIAHLQDNNQNLICVEGLECK